MKHAEAGNKKEKEIRSSKSGLKKMETLLNGFKIGPLVKVLPYVSLEDWFDPYGGFKLQHPVPWSKTDRAYHHTKFEKANDFSWKFRYQVNSSPPGKTKFSLLFKLKLDRDTYFYNVGNSTIKDNRIPAKYQSFFIGTEVRQEFKQVAYRWSPGIWDFKSGVREGGEFEAPSHGRYITSRFTVSDLQSIDYWNADLDNQWMAYAELGLPTLSSTSAYARFSFSTVTRVPLIKKFKLGFGNRFEYLISSDRELVPYFALPEIGSRSGLRGFSKERFRNFGVFVINLEIIRPISPQFELFLLTDVGKTTSELDFLPVKNLHSNYGGGIRFKNKNNPISIGYAVGNEGWKLFSTIATGLPW